MRRSAYLTLASGWTPAPTTQASDIHTWTKFLRRVDLRVASQARSSFVKLPGRASRHDHPPVRRLAELLPVLAQVNRTGFLDQAHAQATVGVSDMIIRSVH